MRSSQLTVVSCALALALMGSSGIGWSASSDKSDPVVAEVGNRKITESELEQKSANDFAKAKSQLLQARFSYYLTARSALDKQIEQQLLEDEAKKENLTVDQLLKRDVDSKIKEPSEETLHIYYLATHTKAPYADVRDKIKDAIHAIQATKAKDDYMKALRQKHPVTVTLLPPREEVAIGDVAPEGPENAPITLIEFADYQCPYCRQMEPDVNKLREQFKGKIRYSYRDFPLPMHQFAQKAAEAARCAGKQGKYWPYHDRLFSGDANKDLAVPQMKVIAREMKLDGDQFDKCLDSGQEAAAVTKDATEGKALGISGTPTFFINGYVFSGSGATDDMVEVIKEQINEANKAASAAVVPGPQARAHSAQADCDVDTDLKVGLTAPAADHHDKDFCKLQAD